MMTVTRACAALLVLTLACDINATKDSTQASPPASAPVPTPIPGPKPLSTAVTTPKPGAAPTGTTPERCTKLTWDAEKQNATARAFDGTVSAASEGDANGKKESFDVLQLTKAVCDADDTPVSEIQLYASDTTISLKKSVGKQVTIVGAPFRQMTAHHHRPLVLDVTKLTVN